MNKNKSNKSKTKQIQLIDLNEEDLPLPIDDYGAEIPLAGLHSAELPSAELHPAELPTPFFLSKEEEDKLIQERINAKKWRDKHYLDNPKYRNSPIPEDLLPDYKRRTPTPTMEMIKKDLDEKRKEDHWEEKKKGGRKKKTMRKSKRKKMRKVRKSRKRNTRRRRK